MATKTKRQLIYVDEVPDYLVKPQRPGPSWSDRELVRDGKDRKRLAKHRRIARLFAGTKYKFHIAGPKCRAQVYLHEVEAASLKKGYVTKIKTKKTNE